MYAPQLGRFMGVDAYADILPGITPYHYAFNNPVNFTDPSGNIPIAFIAGLTNAGLNLGIATLKGQKGGWGRTALSGFIQGAGMGLTIEKGLDQALSFGAPPSSTKDFGPLGLLPLREADQIPGPGNRFWQWLFGPPKGYIDIIESQNFYNFWSGFLRAVASNNSPLGIIPRIQSDDPFVNQGLLAGDIFSFAQGIAEIMAGGTFTGGGTLMTVGTGGLSAPVTIPAAVAGVYFTTHGTSTATNAGINLAERIYDQYGRVYSKSGTEVDRKLRNSEIKKLQEKFSEGDDKFIERLKAPGGRGAGKFDLFKDAETGEIIVKPKKNADLPEPGEPTGYHIDDLD